MAEGPITKNGIHPITHQKPTVKAIGHKGSEREAKPKATEVAKEGAKPVGGGKHMQVGKTAKPMEGKVAAAETLANKFYPTKLGLRGQPL